MNKMDVSFPTSMTGARGDDMPTAQDVADYVLSGRSRTSGYQLQKFVYYCQAWSLVVDGEPLFDEPIEAWANGPVIRSLWKIHKSLWSIPKSLFRRKTEAKLDDSSKRLIDAVLKEYGHLSGDELAAMTHLEDPWIDSISLGSKSSRISEASMLRFYSSLMMKAPDQRGESLVPDLPVGKITWAPSSTFEELAEDSETPDSASGLLTSLGL